MSQYDPNYLPTKHYCRLGQKVVISNEFGELLLLKRSQLSGLGGKWSLPGGALEEGEEIKEGILRELLEETNITVKFIEPFYVFSRIKQKDTIVIIAYKAEFSEGDVKLNWEHDAYSWVTKDEALSKELTPDAREIVSHWGV